MNQAIAQVMQSVNAYYGPGTIQTGNTLPRNNRFYTSFRDLDHVTSGIPRGRIVEIFGADSSGKTTLARFLAESTGEVLYMDADNGLGDVRGMNVMHPETLEDALQAVEIAASAFDAVVIDSLTALQTREEAKLAFGEFHTKNSAAVVLSRALPRLSPVLLRNGCTLILVTQLRDIPGVIYGRPDRPTEGRALRHYASLRLETRRTEIIRQGQESIGQKTNVMVCKNKYGASFGRANMVLVYGDGWRTVA